MDFLDAIRRESDRFYEIATSADPTVSVASCPGWTVADLTWHLAEVHWFWATDVEMRATSPDEVEQHAPLRPAAHDEVVAFGRSQVDRLIGLLDATPDDVAVWTWALQEDRHDVGFVRRHQAQEAAVHRWDMQHAVTAAPLPIDADVAADAIDEMLDVTLPWIVRPDRPLPGTVHVHCTDVAGEWYVNVDGSVERVHAKGDVAIRGSASDLLLALYKRVPISAIEVLGDVAVAGELLARINTE